MLESLEHAQRRGANIICEFAGGALGCDAHHMTEPRPDGSGVKACIEQAVRAGESIFFPVFFPSKLGFFSSFHFSNETHSSFISTTTTTPTPPLFPAGLSPEQVDYVNAHATSTPAGDVAEFKAIRGAIPGNHVRVNGTKSMIGHLLGAAGAVEAVAAVQAIVTGKIHPTLNVEDPDPSIDMSIVVGPGAALERETNVVLSNSFGFGGHNSSIIFRKFEE